MTRWTVDGEVALLKRYASQTKNGIVEIGSYDGDTTAEMASSTFNLVHAIDPIVPDSMEGSVGNAERIRSWARKHGNIMFHNDYSYNVVKNFPYRFDFLFIDGDHNYEAVKRDFEDWFPLLEFGGYIAFHDSAPTEDGRFGGWPGPTQLADELALKFIERVDTIRVFQK